MRPSFFQVQGFFDSVALREAAKGERGLGHVLNAYNTASYFSAPGPLLFKERERERSVVLQEES